MGKALDKSATAENNERYPRDWRKSMSDTVAYSLLVYTGLHIFVTVKAMQETGWKSLALLALVVLVAAIIPLWRKFERRWTQLDDEQAHDPSLVGAFRRDQLLIWAAALGLPVLITALVRGVYALGA